MSNILLLTFIFSDLMHPSPNLAKRIKALPFKTERPKECLKNDYEGIF